MELLQERLGYTFSDRRILVQALTHRSYGHENHQTRPIATRDNERLEFLGDTLLDVVVSDILLERYPESNEGQLSRLRASMVNEKTLGEIALGIGLDRVLLLGRGEENTGGREKLSILSGTLEAVIAAIYLDGGFSAIFPIVRHLFSRLLPPELSQANFYDHKTQLQELCQARWKTVPSYRLIQSTGPDHAKLFEVEVRIHAGFSHRGIGPSKKDAEQNAAQLAIQHLPETL